jgi:peptide deformylase
LIERPKIIKLKYYDEKSVEKIEYFNEIKSRIVQHELEHLEGISFLEKKVNLLETIDIDEIYKTNEIFDEWYNKQREKNYLIT